MDPRRRRGSIRYVAPLIIVAFAPILAIGCQRSAFKASKLPQEFRVSAKANRDGINLASITSPGGGESRIDPGDLLELNIASGRDEEKPSTILTRVSETGSADIPLVGPVQVAGLEPFEASQHVAQASMERGIYRRPHVALEIKSKSVNRVTVLGAVANPGVHELPRAGSDLVKALAMAGGMSEEAGTIVEIVRQPPLFGSLANNSTNPADPTHPSIHQASFQQGPSGGQLAPQTERIDLANQKPTLGDFRLGDRDIVMVMPRDKEMVYVTGLVNKPGQFDLPAKQELRLLDALAMAGGPSSQVADKVLIIRHVPDRVEPIPISASIAAAKANGQENLVLGAGDVVSIEQTPVTAVVDTLMKLLRFSVGVAGRTTVF
jgi:polysaccharide export outer membrane protein